LPGYFQGLAAGVTAAGTRTSLWSTETLREAAFDLDDPKARSRKRSVNLEW